MTTVSGIDPTGAAVRFARRIGWGLADQGLSSLTNFVVGIVVARSVGVEQFGAFGLAFAAYLIVVGLSRAVTAQPVLIRYSGVDPSRWRSGAAAATGTALLIGLGAAPIAAVIGLLAGGSVRTAFVALAIVLPGMILQDAWRFAFFARGRGRAAFMNDALWTVVQVAILGVMVWSEVVDVFVAVLAWGGAANVAALFGVVQSGVVPRPSAVRAWWHEHRDLLPPYIGEFAANTLAGQLMVYAVGFVAGLAVVGAQRGAQVLLGPIYVVVQGVYLVAVPEAVRVLRTSVRRLALFCVGAGVALAAFAMAWTVALLLIPDPLGIALMGEVWTASREIVLNWGLSFAAVNVGVGAAIGLRALEAAARTLRAAAIGSAAQFVGAVAGAYVGGVVGAAWGYLAACLIWIAIWWWEFRAAVRDRTIQDRSDDGPISHARASEDELD